MTYFAYSQGFEFTKFSKFRWRNVQPVHVQVYLEITGSSWRRFDNIGRAFLPDPSSWPPGVSPAAPTGSCERPLTHFSTGFFVVNEQHH
jgi:hypothetical protein